MEFPDIDVATTPDGVRIAYQKWGDGSPLIIRTQIISDVEVHNEHEDFRRVREDLGRLMTCVEFDERGIGLSDRLDGELPDFATCPPDSLPRVAEHYRRGEDPFPLHADGIRRRFVEIAETWGMDATRRAPSGT